MAYNRDRDRLFEYQDPNRGSFNSFQKDTALDMEGAQFDRLGSANRSCLVKILHIFFIL